MKTKKQLVTLILGAAWVSGAALFTDDGLQFFAFAFPGIAGASLFYAEFSRRFRRPQLIIVAAMAAWVSIALFVGKGDCCATVQQYRYLQHYPSNLAGDFVRLHGFDGEVQVKPPAAVMLEILQLSIPGVLLGLIGIWWVGRKTKEKSERLEWEINHSPVGQPFPEVSVENFGSKIKPSHQYSFYCYCGMEVIDELPGGVRTFAVACSSCGHEYDISQNGRRWTITACR
jgi:hypothetical protein